MGDIKVPFQITPARSWGRLATGMSDENLQIDPLLDCLVELSRIHGRPETRAGLSAGLPLTDAGMTPSLFVRAATRVGLAAKVARRPLDKIEKTLLPAVLLLQGDTACVLLGWLEDGSAQVLLPETGQGTVTLPRTELDARYVGIAIFVHPKFRFDARTPALAHAKRHWFWGAFQDQLPLYRDVLAAALLINIFALAFPLFSMNIYDRVVPNFAVETLWMLALGLAVVLGIDYTMRLMRGYFVDLAGARIDLRLSALIMERVLGMKLSDRPPSVGAYAATLRSFESLRDFVASATVTAVIDLPFAILFLVVIAWISWPLVFIPLIGLALVLMYSYSVQKRMKALSESTFRASAMRNSTLVESLTAMETIKAHGAERVMQTKLESTAAFLAEVTSRLRLLSSSVVNGVSTLIQLVNVSTIVAGVYLIHEGHLTMGGLIACTMLSGRAMQPLGQLVALMMQYENARTALEHLETTMAKEGERPEGSSFLHRTDLKGDIVFQNVHFSYPGRTEEALRDVSFRIGAGEKVVVIGRVGSGKTTLQRLILGLYTPTKGAVTIDGVDLRQLDPMELRRSIGYVEQDAMLFYGTLRDNIRISVPLAEDAAIVAAADVGGLTALADKHPQGFDMVVGERGESLSGGQRQGVAIARAALLDPPVLLLDEPTGSMDFSSEAQFKERLRHFAQHRTVLVVTHRNSLLEIADRIIVLDEGRIVADGPREKVLDDLKAGRVGKAS
ncbi:type I secretion system permease/ATPase [Caenimonas sp. SL110]|uniref:type I secretion system permease/ATPase n=1 Tax=Caenimonas sp. SL110 TaxID=1450524 RepID=UPI0009E3DA34|nr:type I secretion system permease/ATPase [Caenimonas sp. SL110]